MVCRTRPMPEAVVGVVEQQGRFLMIKRASTATHSGWWGVPSGKIERGETQPEAVIRELTEELGISTRPIQCLWTSTSADGMWKTYWWETALVDGRVVPAAGEVEQVRWCSLAEIRRLSPLFETDLYFFTEVWPSIAKIPSVPKTGLIT